METTFETIQQQERYNSGNKGCLPHLRQLVLQATMLSPPPSPPPFCHPRFTELFSLFARFGNATRRNSEMCLSNLDKWMTQAGVIPEHVSKGEACVAFNQLTSKRRSNLRKITLSLRGTLSLLRRLSRLNKFPYEEIMFKMINCGPPSTNNTTKFCGVPVFERLHNESRAKQNHRGPCTKCMLHNRPLSSDGSRFSEVMMSEKSPAFWRPSTSSPTLTLSGSVDQDQDQEKSGNSSESWRDDDSDEDESVSLCQRRKIDNRNKSNNRKQLVPRLF